MKAVKIVRFCRSWGFIDRMNDYDFHTENYIFWSNIFRRNGERNADFFQH